MKIKVKQQGTQTLVKVNIDKNETLSEKDILAVAQNPIKGVFSPQLKSGGMFNKAVIECETSHSIPLSEYLCNEIRRNNFYFVMAQVVGVIGRLQKRKLPPTSVVLDLRYIFVNPQSHEMKFLFIPLAGASRNVDILGFIKAILNFTKPDRSDDQSYYRDFVEFCARQQFFSLDTFTRYLVERDRNAAIVLNDITPSALTNVKTVNPAEQAPPAFDPSILEQMDQRTILIDEEEDKSDKGAVPPPTVNPQANRSNMAAPQPKRSASNAPEYLPDELIDAPKRVENNPAPPPIEQAKATTPKPESKLPPPPPPAIEQIKKAPQDSKELPPPPPITISKAAPQPQKPVQPTPQPMPEVKPAVSIQKLAQPTPPPMPEVKPAVSIQKPTQPTPPPMPEVKPAVSIQKPAQPTPPPMPEVKPAAPVQKPTQPTPPPMPEVKPAAPVQKPTQPTPPPMPEVKPAVSIQKPAQPTPPPMPEVKPAAPVQKPAQPAPPPMPEVKPAVSIQKPTQPTPPPMPEVKPAAPIQKPAQPTPPPMPEVKPAVSIQKPVQPTPPPMPEVKPAVSTEAPKPKSAPEFKPMPMPELKPDSTGLTTQMTEYSARKAAEVKPKPVTKFKPLPLPKREPKNENEIKPTPVPVQKPVVQPVAPAAPVVQPTPAPVQKPVVQPVAPAAPVVQPTPAPVQKPVVQPAPQPQNGFNIPDVTPPPFKPVNDYVKHPEKRDEDVVGTVLLSSLRNPFTGEMPKNPRLIRKRTGQEFPINKPNYLLGKERVKVDGYITGNSAVSRIHAEISTRDGRYFLQDLRSTNYTYINGAVLGRDTEVEFFDGDTIMLADEEFIFKI